MSTVLVTGSSGLIGSESVRFFCKKGFDVIGIDNDMRAYFFGSEASTDWNKDLLIANFSNYTHHSLDIRDEEAIDRLFAEYNSDVELVIHTAAQPSHDWAAKEPKTDFSINANGTLNLLEATRQYCPNAVFIFTSTNKVYGDRSNSLPLIEIETRWEIEESHPFYHGIDETMSVDKSKHSLFGASKLAADILVQEYGRYFGLKTVSFRGGCLTGSSHSGTMLHGFLSYLVKCAVTGNKYTIFGYKGKQVRDNIHSSDLVSAFYHFYKNPKLATVYNIGGGRANSCSILEAIDIIKELSGKNIDFEYTEENREGDHIWWISSLESFKKDFPEWSIQMSLIETIEEILGAV